MPISITVPTDDPRLVRTALAPAAEAMLSLHVLLDAKRHPLQHPWVRQARALPAGLRREVRALASFYVDALPDCFLPESDGSFDDELRRLRALPAEDAAYELARPLFHYSTAHAGGPEWLADPEVRRHVLDLAERDGPDCRAVAELIFDDPVALRDRLCNLLQDYWDEAFGSEWERLEPLLREEASAVEQRVREGAFWPGLAALRGALAVDAEARTFVRRSPHEHAVTASEERPLLLIPSVYVWPHVRVNCDEPWPLALIYPPPAMAQAGSLQPVPDALLGALRAAADPTRLRLLRLLAERERSPEELAPLVRMGQAGLSRHLRALAEAGLVRTRRDGYYVLYEADLDRLRALGPELLDWAGPG